MNRWQSPSIRVRLTLVFSLGTTVLTFLFSIVVYEAMSMQLVEVVDTALDDRLDDLTSEIKRGRVDLADENRLAQIFDQELVLRDQSSGVPEGMSLVDPENLTSVTADEVLRTTRTIPGLSFRVRTAAIEIEQGGGTMIVIVARSLAGVDESRQRILRAIVIAAPVIAAIVSLAGRELVRRVLRPVQDMADRAQLVAADSVLMTVGETTGHDEFNSLALSFNSLLARIDGARSRERQFIADVSHELRTPLSVVRAELETLAFGAEQGSQELVGLHSGIDEIDRMMGAIERLLLLARADARQLTEMRTTIDFANLIASVVQHAGDRDGVLVEVNRSGASQVVLDANVVRLIVGNIVANGIRHARTRVSISSTTHRDHTLEIVVADDGLGFSDEIIGSATERFARGPGLPGDVSAPRIGLGLSIVRALCAAIGATVALGSSDRLGGAQVTVILPIGVSAETDRTKT